MKKRKQKEKDPLILAFSGLYQDQIDRATFDELVGVTYKNFKASMIINMTEYQTLLKHLKNSENQSGR